MGDRFSIQSMYESNHSLYVHVLFIIGASHSGKNGSVAEYWAGHSEIYGSIFDTG